METACGLLDLTIRRSEHCDVPSSVDHGRMIHQACVLGEHGVEQALHVELSIAGTVEVAAHDFNGAASAIDEDACEEGQLPLSGLDVN